MTGHILAVGGATPVNATATTGLTWFWVIVAAAAGALLRWLAPIGIFVLYLLLHAHSLHNAAHVGDTVLLWVVIAVGGVFIGWQRGGRAMLRHVGEREYLNRLSSAKGISSIWNYWLGDGK